jgi:hemoglobin
MTVVDDFYHRVITDTELAGYFAGTNMNRLKERQVDFFAAALGGPQRYAGATMRDAHRGRGIGQPQFDRVAEHLVASLAAAGVPDDTIGTIVGVIAPLSADIVSSSA